MTDGEAAVTSPAHDPAAAAVERRAAESEVRAALELMPQLVWTTTPDGYHDYYNQRWYDFTGMPRPDDPTASEEGWKWNTYLHPDDYARTAEVWGHCLRTGEPYEIEYRFKEAATGEYRWFLARALPMRDASGAIVRWFGTCTDIHDKKVTRERLLESEERFRNSMRYSAIGHALVGLDGRFIQVNPALARIVGRTEDDLAGRSFQSITHPEDLDADLHYLDRLVKGEIESYEMEKRYVHAAGHDVSIQLNVAAVRDAEGETLYLIAQMQDLTHRHSLEHRLRESHKLEAVGRLAGGVAHDFNNLLAAITGYVELLAGTLPADAPAQRDLAGIRTAAERGARLTAQLLTFGRRNLRRPTEVDVAAALRESEGLVRQFAGAHIELVIDSSGEAFVQADPSEVDQIVLNLVVNARDAMAAGGTLQLTVDAVEIDADDEEAKVPAGDYVRLRVSDTGVGIAPDVLPHIFEPFFSTKGVGGTGLGLATVYGVVTQNGGSIAVESQLGQGSRFTVLLPRALDAVAAPQRVPQPTPVRAALLHAGTVLLVEDEGAVRDVARRILERAGYTVLTARHGGDALRIFEEEGARVDLLVTDLVMPELGGRETAEAVHRSRPELPVLFMSGYTDDEIMRRALRDPGVAFLTKPFTPAALLAATGEILRRSRDQASPLS